MKEHEFYERLAQTGKFKVWANDGHIRRCSDGACPILAVYRDFIDPYTSWENEDVYVVGKKMGLPTRVKFLTLLVHPIKRLMGSLMVG